MPIFAGAPAPASDMTFLAYIGLGGALTAIGAFLALLAAIALAVLGFVWYPLQRLLRWLRARKADPQAAKTGESAPSN